MMKTVALTVMCLLLNPHCKEVGPSTGTDIMWNPVLVGSGAAPGPASRKGKPMPRLSDDPSQDSSVSLTRWRDPDSQFLPNGCY